MRAAFSNSASPASKAPAATKGANIAHPLRQRQAANSPLERMSSPAPAAPRRARQAVPASAPKVEQVDTPNRAANGRFLSRAEYEAAGEPGGGGESRELRGGVGRLMGKLGDLASSMRDGVAGMVSNIEQVDPAVTAAKEVGDMTAPLKSMAGFLFKPRNEQVEREKTEKKITVPWYRKVWNELRTLNKKSGGKAGGGVMRLGGIGGMLMKLPGVGMLASLLGKLGSGIKPLLGVFGKLAMPLTAMFSAVTSFGTSTEEYARRMGVELNGSLAQELGVRFVGVLGDFGNALTFGLAGKFGEYIAPAVSTMVEGMLSRWDKTSAWVESKWADMTGKFDAVTDGIRKWFADKFGSVGDKAKVVAAAASTKVGDAKESTGNWIRQKADAVASAFGGGSKGRKAALQAEMLNAGITDPREQAMFMAQMDHESDGFTASEESFRYRSVDRLMAVSGTARKKGTAAVEAAMAQGPEAVAELMYGGRLGNTDKGDGYKFRGRGAIQLTGKDNYAAASKDLGIDLLSNPDMAADPAVAAKVATWYWKKNKLGEAARAGDVTGVTKKINGGTNGLADRQQKYQAYLATANTGKMAIENGVPVSRSVSPQPPASANALVRAPAASPKMAAAPAIASAAPSAESQAVPPVPSVPRKIASNDTKAPPPLVIEQPLSQNLSDRGLAQAATGGIGMNLGGR
ncbi:hypothetical protein BBI09_16675 [Stutzerimonas xanthomarina]|nr:hypothetical protein BBI09_16675 [Stutzerimonas xanthomarina]